jgi:mannobiose 2-epimerase
MDSMYQLNQLKDNLETNLVNHVLPFWKEHVFDTSSDGFWGKIDNKNLPDRNYPKYAVFTARLLWTYASAFYQTKDERYHYLADKCYDYMKNYFLDKDFGGVFFALSPDGKPISVAKRTIAQAFAVIAFTKYYETCNVPEALRLAEDIQALVLEKLQVTEGGFSDTRQRNWYFDPGETIWSMNPDGATYLFASQLHMLEAATALQRADPTVTHKAQLRSQLHFFFNQFWDAEMEHFLSTVDEEKRKPANCINFGSEFECIYLLRNAARACADTQFLDSTREVLSMLAQKDLELGYDHTYGGIFFQYWLADRTYNRCKVWWTQAEAIIACLEMYWMTKELLFLDRACSIWAFIDDSLIDHMNGEWFPTAKNPYKDKQSVIFQKARDQRMADAKASEWKSAYHTVRVSIEGLRKIDAILKGESPWEA